MNTELDDQRRVLGAMRSGEWLRTQWILRVAFEVRTGEDYRPLLLRARHALGALEQRGSVVRRDASEVRSGHIAGVAGSFAIPRDERRRVPVD